MVDHHLRHPGPPPRIVDERIEQLTRVRNHPGAKRRGMIGELGEVPTGRLYTHEMGTEQLTFTEAELLATHDLTEPLIAGGTLCHGGFDAACRYVSPPPNHRTPPLAP